MGKIDMVRGRFRHQTRKTATRDAKLIIIATEGSKTEPQYFDSLRAELRLSNVKFLKRKSTQSSPKDVVKRLDTYKKANEINKHDELWLVIDNDGRREEILNNVAQEAKQKNYHLADSNPCFELWLLLHYKRLNELKGLEGAATDGCKSVEKELKKFDSTYAKSKYDTSKYIKNIDKAIKNAKRTDTQSQDRWLNQIGTRVYRLAKSIVDSSPSAQGRHN